MPTIESRLALATHALECIVRATSRSGDQTLTVLEIASDALADLRDPACGTRIVQPRLTVVGVTA